MSPIFGIEDKYDGLSHIHKQTTTEKRINTNNNHQKNKNLKQQKMSNLVAIAAQTTGNGTSTTPAQTTGNGTSTIPAKTNGKPVKDVKILVTDEDWYGVPTSMRTDNSYFRNVNLDEIAMLVRQAKSKLSLHDVMFVRKAEMEAQKGKPEPKYSPIKITGPPCRIKWPSLHATGDYPGIKGQKLTSASFNVLIYEGNVPQDVIDKFPAIEREQAAFFDFLERLQTFTTGKMWEDPEIRKDEKESAIKSALAFLQTEDASVLKDPAKQENLRKMFFEGANKKGKAALVRRKPGSVPGRYFLMKKSISNEIEPSKVAEVDAKTRTGKQFLGRKHYIDELLDDPKPRKYNPPRILNSRGVEIHLGTNENQALQGNDMCIPSFFPKLYDIPEMYGIRALYCCLQLTRSVRDNEKDNSGTDYSEFAEDTDEIDIFTRKRKNGDDEDHKNEKKQKVESNPPPATDQQDAKKIAEDAKKIAEEAARAREQKEKDDFYNE